MGESAQFFVCSVLLCRLKRWSHGAGSKLAKRRVCFQKRTVHGRCEMGVWQEAAGVVCTSPATRFASLGKESKSCLCGTKDGKLVNLSRALSRPRRS